MAENHSFDIVSEVNSEEVLNATTQAVKEVKQRYDLKNTNSNIEYNKQENLIVVTSSDEYTVKSVNEVLKAKLVKRGVSVKALDYGEIKEAGGNTAKQEIMVQQGIPKEKAKDIVKAIKESKKKVQSQIQDDQVRVTGKSIDDLQDLMKMLKEKDYDIHLQFVNYR